MKKPYLAGILLLLLVFLCLGWGERPNEFIYNNTDFNFSIQYPPDYKAKTIKWLETETGVTLTRPEGEITVQAMPAGTDYEKMPFDKYVKIAAASEIQNFEEQVSSEVFTSEYGIKGFKTYWKVIETVLPETGGVGDVPGSKVVGPIYYFPPTKLRKVGAQPVKTIMLSQYTKSGSEEVLLRDLALIAESFRYLGSYKLRFDIRNYGKVYLVKKGEAIHIELPGNATTGYNWFIDELDESRFKVEGSGYNAEETERVGSGGVYYYDILPLKDGIGTIKLLYYRTWEGKTKAADEYRVQVVVK